MKKYIFLIPFLAMFFSVGHAYAASSILQSCTNGHYNTATSCTLPNNLSGGATLVAVGYSSASGMTLSISGCGLTWTNVFTDTASPNFTWDVWTAPSTAGISCSPSQTGSGSPYYYNFLNVMEISGIGVFDVAPADHRSTCGSNCTSASLSTNTNGDFVLIAGFLPGSQFRRY